MNPLLTGQPDTAGSADIADAPGTPVAPPVYDVFAPNATNSGPNPAPVANHPAQTTTPPASVNGATTSVIEDGTANPGFPGFDGMEANNALGYTAALQEAGVPVTYTYLSDIHDDHYRLNHGNAFGPGEAGAEAQLAEYDAAFQAFFTRLAADGITKANTLFLVTVDEGDHFAGGGPLNPGCDGANTPCQYDTAEAGGAAFGTPGFRRNVGEADVNLPALVKGVTGDQTTFGQDFDDAPTIFVPNQAEPPLPARPLRPGRAQARARAGLADASTTRSTAASTRSPTTWPTWPRRAPSTWSTSTRRARRRSRCSETRTSSFRRRARTSAPSRACRPRR